MDFGILSQHIENIDHHTVTASLGCSDGVFRVMEYNLTHEDEDCISKSKQTAEISADGDLILNHNSTPEAYALAMDSGNFHILDKGTLEVKYTQEKAHEYQMWWILVDKFATDLVYTGADDAKFKGWDTRMPGIPIFWNNESKIENM